MRSNSAVEVAIVLCSLHRWDLNTTSRLVMLYSIHGGGSSDPDHVENGGQAFQIGDRWLSLMSKSNDAVNINTPLRFGLVWNLSPSAKLQTNSKHDDPESTEEQP